MTKKYTIQQMAEQTGLSIHTLRYYDSIGITPSVERSSSGYRMYTEQDVGGLLFIKRLRDTGMPLREIQRYVELYLQGDKTIQARRDLLDQHRRQLETSIDEMQTHLQAVTAKIAMYDEKSHGQTCSDLESRPELAQFLTGEHHD